MESAKGAGRGGSAAYGRALESDSLSRLALEADLRNAFVRGEITPFFQPIVNLKTGAVAGFEALARWRHPRRGLVPPDEFLGLTADLGMMNELGLLMMTQSARQLAEWIQRHPLAGKLFCSVNLSVGEIERPHLCEDVARIIKETGLPKGALKLEVTEGDIVTIELRTDDIPPSLTIDAYRLSKRVNPGQPVSFEFRADHAGTFPFYCNLTSEPGHDQKRGQLIVRAK